MLYSSAMRVSVVLAPCMNSAPISMLSPGIKLVLLITRPPTRSEASTTSTSLMALARPSWLAQRRPATPAPTMTTSWNSISPSAIVCCSLARSEMAQGTKGYPLSWNSMSIESETTNRRVRCCFSSCAAFLLLVST
ncbi:hypothetical protein F443_04293 [Phytophthora nicotianae P1569]|uniref:Uncharacterized protein n=2 Tax=Phytophthora nicotianae TaxID=4792 RepID=V9FQ30_PHYNI|nr:hypothetical protein F443_04293 [Phytophthora nicotianae P1569]ETO81321.1 hypothetical protein F444_04346 [Phytophthora nicotianae P1976]